MPQQSQQLDSLLGLSFEIEGLLMLARRREDMTPSEIFNMLNDKCQALLDGVKVLSATDEAEEPAEEPFSEPKEPEPVIEEQVIEESVIEEPATEVILIEEPTVEEPVNEEPIVEEPAVEKIIVQEPAVEESSPAIALTLNDKFRFSRAFFGGSVAALTDALTTIAAITDPDDLDDYLANDLCLDPENNEDAKDFINLIKGNL